MKKILITILIAGLSLFSLLTANNHIQKTNIDDLTKQNIAQALWQKDFSEQQIPKNILNKIYSGENSNQAFGARFKARLQALMKTKLSFAPKYTDRYKLLLKYTDAHSPQQSYVSTLFLGPESSVGYEPIPADPKFNFPQSDQPLLGYQVGWHFFVGNFVDVTGKHYSVQLMFWQYSLFPPKLAKSLGLSDIENQILEMHLAITDAITGIHYRANNVVVAGTTGLINFQPKPYAYTLGKNGIFGLSSNGDLFPGKLVARGWDMGKEPNAPIEIELYLKNDTGYFFEGQAGASPSVDGLGTLYYSAANLKPIKTQKQTLSINGRKITLKDGRMWYDHQWGTGFMPSGAPRHAALRAVQLITPAAPGGWDWFMMQFYPDKSLSKDGEVQLALSSLHINKNKKFYWQTGKKPPKVMTAPFNGKYIDAKNKTHDVSGSVEVLEWVKGLSSPNPKIYLSSGTWYPAKYRFTINGALPDKLKQITVKPIVKTAQIGFFASGLEYMEGGSVVYDASGKEIGRGFIEGTNYAHSEKTVLPLAGLPINNKTVKLLSTPKVSLWKKLTSFIYVAKYNQELKNVMEKARGM